ncbi:hypothetical protein G3567_04755 [Psychroflexus sp. YR1-1]|uniref:Uncharacterized protein n=1 Tax=Psychroflexus aurantiacus TaxID=2709310 RepID=A0A6B3R1X4_9FLAO|nr:hypothetical protein [Psychroflexus aurantiacus]NEV93460.1 hypothetical protein [Psychroflexus aurantiacus]
MKNSQIFEKKYFEIISKEEKSILQKFKEGVKNELQFNYVSNGILKTYTDEINSILEDQLVKNSQRFIETNFDKYEGDQISNILDNDFNSFVSEHEKEINLPELIESIARLYAYKRIKNNVSNNHNPYSFMYKLNDFEEFTYKNIKSEKPELTEKLRLRVYPSDRPDNKKRKKDYSIEIENTNRYLDTFSDNEKKVLLKALYKFFESNFKSKFYNDFRDVIPATEFTKIVLIISKLKEPEVFYKSSNQSSITKKISEEYTRPEIEILHGLKDRLASQKMTKTKEYIAGLIANR